jgi:3-hydroxybutyryl-CoA dehydratase
VAVDKVTTPASESSPARQLSIDQIKLTDRVEESVHFTEDRLAAFIALMGDRALAHVDAAHARAMGFRGRIVHGLFVGAGYSRLLGMMLPGSNTIIHSLDLKMRAPVYVGDHVTFSVEVTRVTPAVGSVQLALQAVNQDGAIVSKGNATCVFCKLAAREIEPNGA